MPRGTTDKARWNRIVELYKSMKDKPKYADANAMTLYEDIARKVYAHPQTVWRVLQRAGLIQTKAERNETSTSTVEK